MSISHLSHAARAATLDWLASTLELSSVWPELISGRVKVVDSGASRARHYFQLAPGNAAGGSRLNAERVGMCERVLLGEPQKVVAIEAGCSTSTVATAVGDCLRTIGLKGGTSRVPALLVLLLHAWHGRPQGVGVRVERSPLLSGVLQVVSTGRLELWLQDKLTASELEVAGLLVEGRSHVEIARELQKSARTVANQLASAYRKLGVSGRIGLLCYLAARLGTAASEPVLIARADLPSAAGNRHLRGAERRRGDRCNQA